MLTVALILIVVALLFGAGAVPSRALFPDNKSGLRYAAMPVLGFGVLTIALQTLYLLGFTVRKQEPFLVLAILGLLAVDRCLMARKRSAVSDTDWRIRFAPLASGALAVLLCGWPGIDYGYRTYMAYANPDANNYQFAAQRCLDHPSSEKIVLDSSHPGNYNVNSLTETHERSGVNIYLSWVSAICDATAKQSYWVAVCSLIFLIPISVYIFVVLGLDADRRVGLLAAGLMATSSLLGLISFQELLGNLGGSAVLPAALGCVFASVQKLTIRTTVAGALLCSALLSLYPEMFFLLGPVVVCAMFFLIPRLGVAQLARNALISGGSVLAGALLINPVWGYYGIRYIFHQSSAFTGGDSYAFSFTKAILPVTFGLLPFPAATENGGFLFDTLRAFSYCVAALCIVSLVLYVFHRSKDMARPPLLGGLAAMSTIGAYMAFGLHYSYGFFKVVLYGEFLILSILAVLAFTLWNDKEGLWSRWGRTGGAAILLMVAGCNLVSLVWYGAVSLSQQPHGIVNEVGLSGDTSFDDLEELRHVIAPNDSVMVDVHSGIVQMWAAFGLRDVKISLIQPLLYFQSWTADFTHHYADRYVLTETSAHSDIITWQPRDAPVWKSSRFELYPFRDYVALGTNWYGLEHGEGEQPFRWLNNDGDVLLIRPSERHYQVAFQCAPGPGVKGSIRHVEVLVNGIKVHDQMTDGQTMVSTPLFAADKIVNHITIHIAEKPSLIPTDSRLLNVSIAKVRVTGEEAARKLMEAENPVEITVGNLPKYLPSMTEIYSDNWVGPKAELWLGCRGDPKQIEIEGEVPQWTPFSKPLRISVSANGTHLGEILTTGKGRFNGVVRLQGDIRKLDRLRVLLVSNQSFTGQEQAKNGDTRPLSFFFRSIRLH